MPLVRENINAQLKEALEFLTEEASEVIDIEFYPLQINKCIWV
jgi:hypothetical protein